MNKKFILTFKFGKYDILISTKSKLKCNDILEGWKYFYWRPRDRYPKPINKIISDKCIYFTESDITNKANYKLQVSKKNE